jgi:CTP synthase (UTP-ammonia lyase)
MSEAGKNYFGSSVEGKVLAAHWARTNNIPYLGN